MIHRFTAFAAALLAAGVVACSAPHQATVWSFRTDRPWLAGYSDAFTPAVDGGSAFFCGGYFWNNDDALHALSLKDGRVSWMRRVGACRSAPWLVAGTLVVHSTESRDGPCVFQGLDPATAKVRWRREFQKDVPVSVSKCVIHEAVAGESIVFAFAGERDVHALRAGDGAVEHFAVRVEGDRRIWLAASGSDVWFGAGTHVWRWSDGRSQPEESIPLAVEAGSPWYAAASGSRLLLGDQERPGALRAFDLATGRLRWERTALPGILSMSAGDEAVYLNLSRRPPDLIAVDVNTGADLWATGVGGFYAPMKDGGKLYANGSNAVVIVDAKTGRIARTIAAEAEVITTPVLAGDLLLFGTINGALHAVRIGG